MIVIGFFIAVDITLSATIGRGRMSNYSVRLGLTLKYFRIKNEKEEENLMVAFRGIDDSLHRSPDLYSMFGKPQYKLMRGYKDGIATDDFFIYRKDHPKPWCVFYLWKQIDKKTLIEWAQGNYNNLKTMELPDPVYNRDINKRNRLTIESIEELNTPKRTDLDSL